MLKSKAVLAIISGLLLSLSWPTYGFPFLLFFAFVPLFILEEEISKESHHKNRKIFFYSYLAIFIWNVITTWWIWNSTAFGAIMAIILNSLFMSLVWVIFSFSKRHFFNQKHAIFLLPIFWVAFEYLHLDWDLSWSWLNLGNAFANHIYAIQWYEYTGTFGGTWWVLIVNILIFKLIQKMKAEAFEIKKLLISSIPVLLFIFIPLSISLYIYKNYEDQGKAVEIVVVQPNMDPWNEQFMSPSEEVIQRMIDLSKPLISEDTRFWLAPESAIQEGLKEPKMTVTTARGIGGISIPMLQEFMVQYPTPLFWVLWRPAG